MTVKVDRDSAISLYSKKHYTDSKLVQPDGVELVEQSEVLPLNAETWGFDDEKTYETTRKMLSGFIDSMSWSPLTPTAQSPLRAQDTNGTMPSIRITLLPDDTLPDRHLIKMMDRGRWTGDAKAIREAHHRTYPEPRLDTRVTDLEKRFCPNLMWPIRWVIPPRR